MLNVAVSQRMVVTLHILIKKVVKIFPNLNFSIFIALFASREMVCDGSSFSLYDRMEFFAQNEYINNASGKVFIHIFQQSVHKYDSKMQ